MRGHRWKGSSTRWIAAPSARKGSGEVVPRWASGDLVGAGDGPQQRLEPIHVLADVRIEVVQANAARRDALRANLFLELGIRAHGDDRVMKALQHGRG